MNHLLSRLISKRNWISNVLGLALVGALVLGVALIAFPTAAAAKNSGPSAMVFDKEKTKTPEPTETPKPTKTPEPTETPEPSETPQPTRTRTPEPSETPRSTATPGGPLRLRLEIKGQVEARPETRVGVWRIAGQDIVVDATTRFIEKKGPAVVGAIVEVKGFRQPDGRLLATRIKVEDSGGQPITTPQPPPTTLIKWKGFIEQMPANGLLGSWQVAGRTFTVTTSTQIKDPPASYRIGVFIQVHGIQAADGSITAHEIELEKD